MEFYNLLVEETYKKQKLLIFEDSSYLKIDVASDVKWKMFQKHKETLAFNKVFHKFSPPLYVVSTKPNLHESNVMLEGSIEQFLKKFPSINDSFDLPAAVNANIYLGALRHITPQIIKSLKIKLILSGAE